MKIKKTFQGELPENRVVNTYSDSLTDAYSANYLNDKLRNVEVSSTEPTNGKDIWVQIGKNLFDKTKVTLGITPTSGGGFEPDISCTVNYVKVNPGEVYMISSNVDRQWVFNISKEIPSVGVEAIPWTVATGTAVQVTIPDGYEYLNIRSHTSSNGEDNISQNIQVEQGEFKTEYEPYIPKKIYVKKDEKYELIYDEANARKEVYVGLTEPKSGEDVWIRKSKNLLNTPYTVNNKLTKTAEHGDHFWETDYVCYLEAGKTYTMSFDSDYDNNVVEMFIYYNFQTGNVFSCDGSTKRCTFVPSTTGYHHLRYDVNNVGETASFWNFQVQRGSTVTPYEPYVDKKIYTRNDNGDYEEFYSYSDISALNDKFKGLGHGVYANANGGNDVNISSHGHGLYWMNTNWGNGFFIWNGSDLDCYCGRGDANGYTLDIHVRASGLVSAWALNSEGNIASYPNIYTIIKVSNF